MIPMKHLRLLLLVGLCGCNAGGTQTSAVSSVTSEIPNVILISIDTLRADRLSAYGYSRMTTPHLDAVAADGILFEKAMTPVPITLPAHASLLTGTYPAFHGVRDNSGFVLPDDQETLAEILKSSGYRTGAFVGAFVLDSRFGLSQGFDLYFDDFEPETLDLVNLQINERPAEEVLTRTTAWLMEDSGKPFFAWIHLFDPHVPYAPPLPFRDTVADPYDGEIAYVDSELGKFFQMLKREGLYDNSLIVIVSDHGEGLGEHGEDTHGMFLYDSTLHVPMIFKLPGQAYAGNRVSRQVRLIDVFPTVLQILELPLPSQVQGKDLTPAWTGGGLSQLISLSETELPHLNYGWASLRAVRTEEHKFIEAPEPEFYDLSTDPKEQRNLFKDSPSLAGQLRLRLDDEMERFSAEAPGRAHRQADDETLRRLRALGYVGSTTRPDRRPARSDLPDPKEKIQLFNQIWRAQGMTSDGNYRESIKILSSVLTEDPKIYIAHSIQAINYLQIEDPAGAISHLREAANLRPEDAGSHFYLAMAYSTLGDLPKAIIEFEITLELDPSNEAALTNLGTLYVRQGHFEKAATIFNRQIETNPRDIAALVNLGVVYLMQQEPEHALRSFQSAVAVNPNLPEVHNNIGLIYLNRQQFDRAVESFQEALRLRPDYANAKANLEIALRKGG
jgi:arylsulfatase A-like enzyme/Flp pilus assembly protein TadD